mgnify:CR=1 FL=1
MRLFEYQPRKSENWYFGVFFTFNPEQGFFIKEQTSLSLLLFLYLKGR